MARQSSRNDELSILSELAQAARAAWESGSPVAGYSPEDWERIAAIALRRWRSFARRNKSSRPDRARRVEDLAKGLRNHFEDDISLVGPLMEDYRWLAEQLAEVLEQYDSR